MKKIRLGKDALILSILTLITALTWVGLEVYQALTTTEIPKVLQEQITPLNDKLPQAAFEELDSRLSFNEAELNQATVFISEEEESEEATGGSRRATESGSLN